MGKEQKQMESEISLKPCPFCGSPYIAVYQGEHNITFFQCIKDGCKAVVRFNGGKQVDNITFEAEDPIGNWNRRTNQ